MIDCRGFENRLTEVLGGEPDRAALAELEQHADRCPVCAQAAGWIELAALPARDRDPVEEPPEGYWRDFNATVRARTAVTPRVLPGALRRRWASAAVILLALLGGWYLRGRFSGEPTAVTVEESAGSAGWSLLEEAIRDATPEELATALRNLPGDRWGGFEAAADLGGPWVPDVADLDEIDEEQLTEWLDQLDRTEGRPIS